LLDVFVKKIQRIRENPELRVLAVCLKHFTCWLHNTPVRNIIFSVGSLNFCDAMDMFVPIK
jgi:hypothetical protein